MNVSGPSIAAVYRQTVNSPDKMIVLSDSLSHSIHKLSARQGGSPNGHNGLRSIINALGGEKNFHTFRIGIGRDGSDAAQYVLSKLPSQERVFWQQGDGFHLVISAVESVVRKYDSES
jgi:peptidyl-tRNA hydrolase, PTH1 family